MPSPLAELLGGLRDGPKDLDDVAAVVAGPDLDLGYLRATLGELEQAIDRSDLLPLLESVLGRARG